MNVFEAVKQSVTTRQAAEHYGIHVGRNGMACCPFHNDKTPSMKLDRRYANITELDAATLNRLIKEIVVHERIDEDKTRHISIEIHFNLKPIPEVEQVTA